MNDEQLKTAIEGILFAIGDSITPGKIAAALEIEKDKVIEILSVLQAEYEESERGIRITELEGAYQMCTSPDIYEYLIKIAKQPKKLSLTDTLLETLSIIAYKQPVTKSEIEKIRGVSCEHAVSRLVEFGLVKELGRLDAPGRPLLFGTTEEFLRTFGVSSVDDLPDVSPTMVEEFKKQAEEEAQISVTI